jgi:hypothetical protein
MNSDALVLDILVSKTAMRKVTVRMDGLKPTCATSMRCSDGSGRRVR